MTSYDPTPVEGYQLGIVASNERPKRVMTDRGDHPPGNRMLANDWFTIGTKRYNVHPYRSDFDGYPVRMIEEL